MKSRLFLIIILLVFILITASILARNFAIEPELLLFKAFAETGVNLISSEITFSTGGTNRLENDSDIKRFYMGISGAIGHNLPIIPINVDNDSFIGVEINNTSGRYCNYSLKILKSKASTEMGICYVTLYMADSSSVPALTVIKQKTAEVFREFGIRTTINTCLTGTYPGRLENGIVNEICAGIFKRTSSRKVSGMSDNNLISVSAYSRVMKDTVQVDGRDINLGFAARYNSYEDKTYVWLATPLITKEY